VPEIVVASYNVHGGVDGWGRPFDVAGVCRRIDADVLVLQEVWSPDHGRSLAEDIGEELGYDVSSFSLSRCRMFSPPDPVPTQSSWGPKPWGGTRPGRGMDLRRKERSPGQGPGPGRPSSSVRRVRRVGTWDIAVLTRVERVSTEIWDLGSLRRDVGRRAAIVVDVIAPGHHDRPVTVVGTHMSHLSHGSPAQYRRLARTLRIRRGDVVVTGDMNLWGPPLTAIFRGYSRAVRARTWPTWRPIVQSDHVLVSKGLVERCTGEVLDFTGSDHLPVRARIEL